jgi:hypothetical protein
VVFVRRLRVAAVARDGGGIHGLLRYISIVLCSHDVAAPPSNNLPRLHVSTQSGGVKLEGRPYPGGLLF